MAEYKRYFHFNISHPLSTVDILTSTLSNHYFRVSLSPTFFTSSTYIIQHHFQISMKVTAFAFALIAAAVIDGRPIESLDARSAGALNPCICLSMSRADFNRARATSRTSAILYQEVLPRARRSVRSKALCDAQARARTRTRPRARTWTSAVHFPEVLPGTRRSLCCLGHRAMAHRPPMSIGTIFPSLVFSKIHCALEVLITVITFAPPLHLLIISDIN